MHAYDRLLLASGVTDGCEAAQPIEQRHLLLRYGTHSLICGSKLCACVTRVPVCGHALDMRETCVLTVGRLRNDCRLLVD